jgi:hypothetical protein
MIITTIQAQVSKTATFQGASIDVHAIATPWTIVLEVQAQTAGAVTRFQITDSVNAFSSSLAGPTWSFTGQIGNPSAAIQNLKYSSVKRVSIKQQDFPDLNIGVASGVIRCDLTDITGASASVTYQSWLES